jgi:hypothetical protein
MRVKIKGINKVAKRLADGTKATYYYAWKGGPRLPGKPGDPVFIAAYNEAIATKADQPIGTIQSVLNAYQASPKFADLADRTRKDYIRNIRQIEAEFSAFPIEALTDRRCRGEFFAWRDRLAAKSRRQADYVYATLASIFAWAVDRGMVPVNPCERPGKLYTANRAEIVWSEADEATFLAIIGPNAFTWHTFWLFGRASVRVTSCGSLGPRMMALILRYVRARPRRELKSPLRPPSRRLLMPHRKWRLPFWRQLERHHGPRMAFARLGTRQ